MLKEIYTSLLSNYSDDSNHIESLWSEIEKKHTKKNRYYHNLSHLEHLYTQLNEVKDKIRDWDMVLFALFYHDYIYNTLKQENEEESAKKAIEVLNLLSIDKNRIELCNEIILATKGHNTSKNNDVNYFTDADLSILGSDWEGYKTYFKKVRKEYKYYPDFVYNKGRAKVLQHFVKMPQIFKTHHFKIRYEAKAKENLQQEIDLLSK
ncbi:HD domain-containing protein [Aquimarina sp. 2304DJ70-9]|uniref:HD domain-containing protein n=1 Tax=Aquimarina penaris TaxID=3231044 RepID=UPI003462C0D2